MVICEWIVVIFTHLKGQVSLIRSLCSFNSVFVQEFVSSKILRTIFFCNQTQKTHPINFSPVQNVLRSCKGLGLSRRKLIELSMSDLSKLLLIFRPRFSQFSRACKYPPRLSIVEFSQAQAALDEGQQLVLKTFTPSKFNK